MKRQYLGDAKDAFKWDYHNHLVRGLGYTQLTAMLMMNENEKGKKIKKSEKHPCGFPEEIVCFCKKLIAIREEGDLNLLCELPDEANGKNKGGYKFDIYDNVVPYDNGKNRGDYFKSFELKKDEEIVFIDPCTGFKSRKTRATSMEHLHFSHLEKIVGCLSYNSVISVYQHAERIKPEGKFPGRLKYISGEIKRRNKQAHCAAVYWDGKVMFVQITTDEKMFKRVKEINEEYAKSRELVKGGIKAIP